MRKCGLSFFLIIVLLFSLCGTAFAGMSAGGMRILSGNDRTEDSASTSELTVFFLDVGEGDAAVLLCEGAAMMIDGGPSSGSDYIFSFLKGHQIGMIDYMICTHPDADHTGGLAGALNAASVGTVYSTVTDSDKEAFRDLVKYAALQGKEIFVPDAGDEFMLGSAKVTVLSPAKVEKRTENTSLVLRIEYGSTSFLFTGDLESEQENALTEQDETLKSTVLKVGHHGSSDASSEAFLEKVQPEYAVISVGGKNSYGHPTEATLARLKDAGAELYRTDMHGMITCISDGKTVSFQVEKSTDLDPFAVAGGYLAGSASGGENSQAERGLSEDASGHTFSYVVNTNTGRFHYPDCRSVRQMKDKNRMDFTGTREELIAMGYEPCGNCHP